MKNVIEIINELKARRTEIASNQDIAAIGELAEINATFKTLEPYCKDSNFEIVEWTSSIHSSVKKKFTGGLVDLGDIFNNEDRYSYAFEITCDNCDGSGSIRISPSQMDVVINAMQNAKAEMSDE